MKREPPSPPRHTLVRRRRSDETISCQMMEGFGNLVLVYLGIPSSRDLLHIKFENLNICNGHVNVTKINSKPKFPVTFT